MSTKNVKNTEKNRISLPTQNDVDPVQCATVVVTAAPALDMAAERTTASGKRSGAPKTLAPLLLPSTTSIIGNDNESINGGNMFGIAQPTAPSAGGGGSISSSSSSGGGLSLGADAPGEKRRSSSNGDKNASSKRKTRRGKTKRGKRSSSSRAFSKSQWKFQVNKRRVEAVSLVAATGVIPLPKHANHPLLQSDHPPIVPYNTNRFLMEDHMPHVLTPSEDEEEFLTKEFSSVYEDARSERLEGLSKTQLIQEYLQLEANYDQVTRRYQSGKPSSVPVKEDNESATTKDAPEASTVDRRRLEDRIRELTTENLELRRQLEHVARIGMVLSAKSSPRNAVERMDSSSCGSSSEDSESDSSSSTSSSSSDKKGVNSSSSSMSDDDDEEGCDFGGRPQRLGLVREEADRQPSVMLEADGNAANAPVPMEDNGFHQQNGDEDSLSNGDQLNGAISPLSAHSINSPPAAPLVMN